MTRTEIARDLVVTGVAGFLGSRAMTPVTTKLQEAQSDEAKRREEQVSPGVAYEVAAEKTAEVVGADLDEDQKEKAGMALHYGLGMAWAPLYALLRRRFGLSPVTASVATGLSMFAIVDEALTPALRFSAPPRAYPLSTHARGFVGHLAYAGAVAGVTEAAWHLLRTRPGR